MVQSTSEEGQLDSLSATLVVLASQMTHAQPEDEVMLLGCGTQPDAGKNWSNQPHKRD